MTAGSIAGAEAILGRGADRRRQQHVDRGERRDLRHRWQAHQGRHRHAHFRASTPSRAVRSIAPAQRCSSVPLVSTGKIVGVVTNEGTFNVINANTCGITSIINDGGTTQFFNGTSASAAIIVNNDGVLNFFNTQSRPGPPTSPTATAASRHLPTAARPAMRPSPTGDGRQDELPQQQQCRHMPSS